MDKTLITRSAAEKMADLLFFPAAISKVTVCNLLWHQYKYVRDRRNIACAFSIYDNRLVFQEFHNDLKKPALVCKFDDMGPTIEIPIRAFHVSILLEKINDFSYYVQWITFRIKGENILIWNEELQNTIPYVYEQHSPDPKGIGD